MDAPASGRGCTWLLCRNASCVVCDVGGRWGMEEEVRPVPSGGGSLQGKCVPWQEPGDEVAICYGKLVKGMVK